MKLYDSVVDSPGTDSVAATATAQAATISSAGTLTEAINSVLKKAKPLSALAKSQSQARGRQDALWQAFTQVCTLPVTQDPERMRQFVLASQEAYLVYLQAHEACDTVRRELHQAEQEQAAAAQALKEAIKAAQSVPGTNTGDTTLAAALYMDNLLSSYKSQVQGDLTAAREEGELSEDNLAEVEKLRQAVINHALFAARCQLTQDTLHPLVSQLYEGSGLNKVVSPVRPIEEEVQRYLSQLEQKIHNQRIVTVKAVPLLEQRLKLLSEEKDANAASLKECTAAIDAISRPAMWPYIWALKRIVTVIDGLPCLTKLRDDYLYSTRAAEYPELLDAHDRATPGAVEKDQIAYLRKQHRTVAFAMAHLNETNSAIRAHNGGKVEVPSGGASQNQSWQQCLDWHQQLQGRRAQADLETLRRTTKAELLAKAKEHYEDLVKTEMTNLYKSLCAMIPQGGPKPCNELRELINLAAYICTPLEGSEAAYPIY